MIDQRQRYHTPHGLGGSRSIPPDPLDHAPGERDSAAVSDPFGAGLNPCPKAAAGFRRLGTAGGE